VERRAIHPAIHHQEQDGDAGRFGVPKRCKGKLSERLAT
jgi:hypothetical protein